VSPVSARFNWRSILLLTLIVSTAGAGCFWLLPRGSADIVFHGVVETQDVRLGSKVGGRVAAVKVAEGGTVPAGTELVTFEAPELLAKVAQQKARVEAAKANLAKLEAGPRLQEKQAARAAWEAAAARSQRIVRGWREEEIRTAQADYEAAVAVQRLAKEELERVEPLFKQRATPRSSYDTAVAELTRTTNVVNGLRAKLDMIQSGSRTEDREEAAALERQAKAQFELLEAGTRPEDLALARHQLEEAKALLDELEAQLRETRLLAPEPAIIETVGVRAGDVVSPNQPVIRVLRAEDLWVRIFVPETQLGRVRLGDTVTIDTDDRSIGRYSGKVIQIATISEFTPRNVQTVEGRRNQFFGVKIRIDEPQGRFKTGMAAKVTFPAPPVDSAGARP
jgi:multidrug resistance efflux pump